MEQNQRRRIGLPLTVLIVGLLLLLLGTALTLLNGELKRRTQLDAAGLQATLDGSRLPTWRWARSLPRARTRRKAMRPPMPSCSMINS